MTTLAMAEANRFVEVSGQQTRIERQAANPRHRLGHSPEDWLLMLCPHFASILLAASL